jgi:hypothetical protein
MPKVVASGNGGIGIKRAQLDRTTIKLQTRVRPSDDFRALA